MNTVLKTQQRCKVIRIKSMAAEENGSWNSFSARSRFRFHVSNESLTKYFFSNKNSYV